MPRVQEMRRTGAVESRSQQRAAGEMAFANGGGQGRAEMCRVAGPAKMRGMPQEEQ